MEYSELINELLEQAGRLAEAALEYQQKSEVAKAADVARLSARAARDEADTRYYELARKIAEAELAAQGEGVRE